MSSDQKEEPIQGRVNVRRLLFNFRVPLHVMAEIGESRVTVRAKPVEGDARNETHFEWTIDLVGPFGAKGTLTWSVLRKWNESRVVYERRYDHHQAGRPFTFLDLYVGGLEVRA